MKNLFATPKASPYLFVCLFVFLTSSATAQWGFWGKGLKGNGNVKTENRNLSDFDEVSVSAGIKVFYTQGPKMVKVEADENLLEYILTEVRGDELVIKRKKKTRIKKFKKMNVYVSSPKLYAISASSGSHFESDKEITSSTLTVKASSGAHVDTDLESKVLTFDCSSGAKIDATIHTSNLSAEASSGSSIHLSGKANDATMQASSGASINAKDVTVKHCKADASSAGSISIRTTDSINGSASSGGSVNYFGNPNEVERSTSSGGSVSGQ